MVIELNYSVMLKKIFYYTAAIILTMSFSSCDDDEETISPKDPDTAEKVSIDRFSDMHATLMKRSENTDLPAENEPIDFDQNGFITQSYGPDGKIVRYYNFDVQPLTPAPIYVLVKGESNSMVEGQLNIINVIPGDAEYNDFWQMYFVTVPDDYKANTITSYQEIYDNGYEIEKLANIVNCPVVPYGSTATQNISGNNNTLFRGWYKSKVAYYFSFEEKDIVATSNGLTPTSPIYVTFNINPDDNNPASGPASGIKLEEDGIQSHNVIETIPSDYYYSPLWSVYVYNNADFDQVDNLTTAKAAETLMENAMYVNCPVVYVE